MKKYFKLYVSLILPFLYMNVLSAQPPYSLTVESGGHIEFKVYSLQHYDQGITYTNRTTLRIFCDTLSGKSSNLWYLGVKAQDAEFFCSYPDQSLDLKYVTVQASRGNGENAIETGKMNTDEYVLSSSTYQPLVEGGDAGNYKVDITYHLDSTKGRPPGYYNTNFEYRLDTVPFW
jgi:hypothetical protein